MTTLPDSSEHVTDIAKSVLGYWTSRCRGCGCSLAWATAEDAQAWANKHWDATRLEGDL